MKDTPREDSLRGSFGGACRRVTMRAVGSRFAKPIARIALAAAGLIILAVVGRATVAGAVGGSGAASVGPVARLLAPGPSPGDPQHPNPTIDGTSTGQPRPERAGSAPPGPQPAVEAPPAPATPSPARPSRAAPDDPVFLNAATETDLRRLPGIGAKRADAIVALRARLGRFHAVEDLLKVRGIGRATLKRLRPLIRLDAPPVVDAGAPMPSSPGPSR